MIIDAQYFQTKELYIPNSLPQPSIGSNSPSSLSQLDNEIENIEQSLLLDALGYVQLQELNAQFEPDGSWIAMPEQKWVDLVDGKEDWKGLRYTMGTSKISLIAYYVFFYYLSIDFQQYTTTGMQIANAQNSTPNSPNPKQVAIWNKFISMYVGNNINGSPYFGNNWNGSYMSFGSNNVGNNVTLYQYLSKNNDIYDVRFFTLKTPINYFGI